MKKAIILSLLLILGMNLIKAQLIYDSRLFYLTYEYTPDLSGYLFYYDYTNHVNVQVDTHLYKDFDINNDILLASGEHCRQYQIPSAAPGLSLVLTDSNMHALRGFAGLNKRYYLCSTSPRFRWIDAMGQQYSLPDSLIPAGFTDAMLFEGKFYILYPDELRIIPLAGIPSAVNILPTPKPFPFGGENIWLFHLEDANKQDHIYIIIEYYTALMRTSLIELNTTTMSFDSIFHYNTFSNYYRPLVADGKLYMENFDTHYDPITDSVYFTSNPSAPMYHAVAYGDYWQEFFLHRLDSHMIIPSSPGPYSDTLYLGQDAQKFYYWYDVIGAIEASVETNDPFTLIASQNDARLYTRDKEMTINSVEIFDIQGKLVPFSVSSHTNSEMAIRINAASQVLIFRINTNEGIYTRKAILAP